MADDWDWLKTTIDRIESRLDELKEQLDEIGEKVSECEYRLLTPEEKADRRFDSASPLTLVVLRKLAAGRTLKLISCSYYYPSEESDVEEFEYQHARIDEDDKTQWGVVVYGARRYAPEDAWSSFTFYASDEQSTTSSCAGTIRQLPW